jgi:radical SAM PhpK family P-methyltransferase
MKEKIDCLIIGHNEIDFKESAKEILAMGQDKGAFKDLALSYLTYGNEHYNISELLNKFCLHEKKDINVYNTFHAGVAYLSTFLQRNDLTFDYINSFHDEQTELHEKLKNKDILTIAITTTFYTAVSPISEIISFIRKYNSKVKIIVGGPYITSLIYSTKDQLFIEGVLGSVIEADYIIHSNQGEDTLVKLIKSLKQGKEISNINNLYYIYNEKLCQTNYIREDNPLSENTVDWSLFNKSKPEFVNIRTSISCPFSCSFCRYPEHAGKYQTGSIDSVKMELDSLAKLKSVKCVNFIDDTFNIPTKRFKELLKIMIKQKYSFNWFSYFRCQFADEEMVKLMKESGCIGVYLGIESGNNEILANMNKKVTVEQYVKGIELLKKYDILIYANFIVGFPGETTQTANDTKNFILSNEIDFYRAQLWYCDDMQPIMDRKDEFSIEGEGFEWRHEHMNSNQASEIINDLIMTIDSPYRVPQWSFNIHGILHLHYKGFSIDRIKQFLEEINNAMRNKIKTNLNVELSASQIKKIRNSLFMDQPEEKPLRKKIDESHIGSFNF